MKKTRLFFLPILLFLTLSVSAQVREIKGTVTAAEDGSTLPGVSIRVKGTSTGATTDPNGN
ncbi:carboxypeptidase-like regulatory domain-containing protein [Daejeonella sp.]|uniref:carboxypeptidase-like regulatory domain-containing protein n=1 Tax=Daejeonella sp. TaxID=2805397 RepID=UPI0025BC7052|nr:carboxypeptidase-like regulatory domain-containing protein [Daejeonella sp.]